MARQLTPAQLLAARKALGAALRAARKEAGHTQPTLAEASGTDQVRVSHVENASADTKLSTVIRIADALDMDLVPTPRKRVPLKSAVRRPKG